MAEAPNDLPGPALFAALKAAVGSTVEREQVVNFSSLIFGVNSPSDLLLDSCIYYLVRRLIHFGGYKLQELRSQQLPETDLKTHIEDYVGRNLRLNFTPLERAKIETLVGMCVLEAEKELTEGQKKAALRIARDANITSCYVCGRTLTFGPFDQSIAEAEKSSWVEIEHRFPRCLGGTNSQPNLALACKACNKAKADYAGFPDFHYEYMSTRHREVETDFKKYLRGDMRVAVKLAGDSKCFSCEKTADVVGGLFLGRKDSDDHWHFLNMAPFCAGCHPDGKTPYEL
jgi:hypothetical protein